MAAKWQDWASFMLGLWLALSPWLAGYVEYEAAAANAIFVGLGLALCSHFECVACEGQTIEWVNLAAGVWLVCAPFTLDFASRVATANSIAVGVFVAALSMSALVSALALDKRIGRLWHKAH
jgi:hypothetical protein